jgi:hypothetical protein
LETTLVFNLFLFKKMSKQNIFADFADVSTSACGQEEQDAPPPSYEESTAGLQRTVDDVAIFDNDITGGPSAPRVNFGSQYVDMTEGSVIHYNGRSVTFSNGTIRFDCSGRDTTNKMKPSRASRRSGIGGDTRSRSTVNGDTVDGKTVNGNTIYGETVNGNTLYGSTVNGNTVWGSTVCGSVMKPGELVVMGRKF